LGVYIRSKLFGGKEKPRRKRTRTKKPLKDEKALEQTKDQIGSAMTKRLQQHLAHAQASKQKRSAAFEFKRQQLSLRQRSEIHTYELEIELLRQDIQNRSVSS